jgi:hypothetical protein
MPVMSLKLSEILVKTTHSKDLDDALNKILSEYLELKLKTLNETINTYQMKWGMNFKEFEKSIKDKTLKKDVYSFDTEKDFWQWEEAETLRKHYEEIKKQWM